MVQTKFGGHKHANKLPFGEHFFCLPEPMVNAFPLRYSFSTNPQSPLVYYMEYPVTGYSVTYQVAT